MWKWTARIVRSLVGVIALVASVALFGYLASTREHAKQRETGVDLPIVRAVECVARPVARRWTGYGTARALDASNVAAEIAGRVVERPGGLEAGVAVAAGDLLLGLDPIDYEQRVRSATKQGESIEADLTALEIEESRVREQAGLLEEELAVAQRELDRARDALARGAGNESQVDARLQALQALTRSRAALLAQLETYPARRSRLWALLESARADLRLAEENLSRASIRSPIGGVLQSLDPRLGEWVRAGDTVARVVDLSRIEVPLRLPQGAAAGVSIGDSVRLSAESNRGQSWVGSVVRIAPESDAQTRSLTVFVEIRQRAGDDPATLLRPGQFVMGDVVSSVTETMMIVPRHSVDGGRVLVASPRRDGDPEPPAGAMSPMVVREAEVNVSHHLEARFDEVLEGETQWAALRLRGVSGLRALREGDLVVVSNLDSIRLGDLIDVRIEGAAGSATVRNGGEPAEDRP